MKILFCALALLTFNVSVQAQDHCDGEETCVKGYIPFFKSGTHFAKGEGYDCADATQKAKDNFRYEFGEMECGFAVAPYVNGCQEVQEDHYVAWAICNSGKRLKRKQVTSGCITIAEKLICAE